MLNFTPEFIKDLEALLLALSGKKDPITLRHEHVALHCSNMGEGKAYWISNGYEVVRESGEVVFLKHPNPTKVVIELVPHSTSQHIAYICQKPKHVKVILDHIREMNKQLYTVESENLTMNEIRHVMICHNQSMTSIQFIWREVEL